MTTVGQLLPDVQGQVDVCIVGGGPAGLSVAKGLSGRGLRILVLEVGGTKTDPHVQGLGVGSVTGDPNYAWQPLAGTRRRMLGGTANDWDVQLPWTANGLKLVPLGETDFAQWPFGRSAMEEPYRRAHALMTDSPFDYDAGSWVTPQAAPLPLDPKRIISSVYHGADGAAVTNGLLGEVRRDPGTRVVTDALVRRIQVNDGVATGVDVVIAGTPMQVAARLVVLAAGAIEVARLLLASDDANPAGIGNGHDLVGRHLMDHPLVQTGVFLPTRPLRHFAFYDLRVVGTAAVIGKLEVAQAQVVDQGLPHAAFQLVPRPSGFDPVALNTFAGMLRGKEVGTVLASAIGRGTVRIDLALLRSALMRARGDWPDLSRGTGWSSRSDLEQRFGCFVVYQKGCQQAHRENRVQLSARRDASGERVADVTWRWTQQDVDDTERAQALLADTLEDANMGRVQFAERGDGRPMLLGGTHHHMGTTRMHASPRQGVCTAEGRVHEVANLYVASTALFPAGGHANPTLTLIALSLQMGQRLAGSLTHIPAVRNNPFKPASAAPPSPRVAT